MSAMESPATPLASIVVAGGGLAANMTAAALAMQLPPSVKITLLECQDTSGTDLFYGTLSPPSSYAFNLSCGVSEPRVLLDSTTAFAWGTRFERWGGAQRSWVQCFHLPLPVLGGVLFHHYLTRLGLRELEPFLISAAAARLGAFAHPLEKNGGPLARAEYGYLLDPQSYLTQFAAAARARRVTVVQSQIAEVRTGEQGIAGIRVADGRELVADLYVDCSGPDALLLSRLGAGALQGRRLGAVFSTSAAEGVGAPHRLLTGADYGWQSDTALNGAKARMTVFDPASEAAALASHGADPQRRADVTLGSRAEAWMGNCVGVGHSTGVLEPLSHAPLLLLQRAVERLLTLIPFSAEMSVERREFNRQSAEDHLNAANFHRAWFETAPLANSAYWDAARAEPVHERLAVKLTQFEGRGILAAYDLEPVNPEDWTILHFGMGRVPARYDRVADREPEPELRKHIAAMAREVERFVATLPSHRDYMKKLQAHLRQKTW